MILREVMHAHIPTLNERSTVRDAVDKMDIYQFPALVIVNDDIVPIAVITEGDLARVAFTRGNITSLGPEFVLPYATKEPVCSSVDTEISEAFHRMLMSGLTVMPVTEADRLVGIVLRTDLMQALLLDATSDPDTR